MKFRTCESPVRLFIASNQVEIIERWERDILRTGFADAQYVELVVARPCDTVRVYPHLDTHPQTGQKTEMIFISLDGEVKPDGSRQWHRYRAIYSFHRSERGLELSLQNFEISREEERGHGVGAHILAAQAQAAYRLGFSSIGCVAERKPGRNGYYSWPRLGFDWEIPASMRARLPTEFGIITRLSDIMGSADARVWWKEYGWSVPADFDTRPDSESMHALRLFFEDKGWPWLADVCDTPLIRRVSSLRFDRAIEEPCGCP